MSQQHQHSNKGHESLRTQFSQFPALQTALSPADIPSLPPPRLKSPIKENNDIRVQHPYQVRSTTDQRDVSNNNSQSYGQNISQNYNNNNNNTNMNNMNSNNVQMQNQYQTQKQSPHRHQQVQNPPSQQVQPHYQQQQQQQQQYFDNRRNYNEPNTQFQQRPQPNYPIQSQKSMNQYPNQQIPPPLPRAPIIQSIPPIPRSIDENLPRTPDSYNPLYRNNNNQRPNVKQRSGSEMIKRDNLRVDTSSNRSVSYGSNSLGISSSPSSASSSSTMVNPFLQDQNQSPPSTANKPSSTKKSPIVRQSLNFLKNARNITLSNDSNNNNNQYQYQNMYQNQYQYQNQNQFPPDSPLTPGHSSSREMEKYHQPIKQTTSSGRVIPQKIDYSNQFSNPSIDSPKKSRSLSTLTRRVTSSTSLRSNNDKNRFISTTSLSSTVIQSSPSLKKKYIYPALLSEVADAFLHEIKLTCHFKYGIEYRNSFSGSEAIDVICKITKIRDRNLAIILGRSLDSQKLFHDVTYEHRLRDNKLEIYLINDVFFYNNQNEEFKRQNSVTSNLTIMGANTNNNSEAQLPTLSNPNGTNNNSINIISGVFTSLTECYSPTCSRDKVCYSVSCPRRFEQKMRSEMQSSSSLIRSDSHISLNQEDQKQYWQLTVPKSLLENLDKNEIKRQECIFETINSEKTFIKDLEYIREFWMRPLSETKIIKDKERDQFIRNVFHNINEIWEINHKFAEALVRQQQKSPIVDSIADIFLDFIPQFTPFITYGAGQVIGKYEFDRQRRHNPLLRRFIEDTAKREESKRLDLSSFLSKPTTRPARYPLLLKSIRDHTEENSPDYKKLTQAIELLEKMLTKINFETGKQSDKMNLFQIKQKLLFKPGELVDLKLSADNRKVIYQCVLKKKGYQEKEKQGEIHVYLFDHCILFIKLGYLNKREVYKVYQRPIPLPLLYYSLTEYPPTIKSIRRAAMTTGSSPSLLGNSLSNSTNSLIPLNSTVAKSPLSFKYLGVHGYELTLYGTPATQKILANKIEAQTKKILADNDVYTLTPLSSNFFDSQNKINCVIPFDGGRKLLYGTDSGIYISDRTISDSSGNGSIIKVINKFNIIQIEIIQEYQLLVVLCDKKLLYWSTSVLAGGDPIKNGKLGKELMNHVSFFKIGICDGRMLLCAAKSTSNIVRIFEPVNPIQQKKQKKKFENDIQDINFGSEPVSINFLKTKLCVGCANGFQIVSLVNNTMEELLDPADTSLEFATSKEGLKPLSIDRINSDFLLSYSNFSFFINHNGWRVRPKWIIEWEGVPHSFALWYPYLLAFDTNFIEIRSVQNAELLRVIVGENIRFLHASSQEILYVYENERGYDVVASLDFWDKSIKNNRSRGNTVNGHSKQISVDI